MIDVRCRVLPGLLQPILLAILRTTVCVPHTRLSYFAERRIALEVSPDKVASKVESGVEEACRANHTKGRATRALYRVNRRNHLLASYLARLASFLT